MSDQELVPLPTIDRESELNEVISGLQILWRFHHEKTFGEFLSTVICGPEFNFASLYTASDEEVKRRFKTLREGRKRQFDIPDTQRI